MQDYDGVCAIFAALSAPIRAAIIHTLTDGERSVTELAEAVGESQPLVSHHLRILREAHLVTSRREGKQVRYSLADEHVQHIFMDALLHCQEATHVRTSPS